MKSITQKDFKFTGDQRLSYCNLKSCIGDECQECGEFIGPSEYDITDYADIKMLCELFNENQVKLSQNSERELDYSVIGRYLEQIFTNSKKIQDLIATHDGRTLKQYENKVKNAKRKNNKDNGILSQVLGKGTSAYLHTIHQLIDYFIFGHKKNIGTSGKNRKAFITQKDAIGLVIVLLEDVLSIECSEDWKLKTTTHYEYREREYQKYKENPVHIPGLKAGYRISSKKIVLDEPRLRDEALKDKDFIKDHIVKVETPK